MLLVLSASALFTFASALIKAVAPTIPTAEIVLFRGLIGCVALLPLLVRRGGLGLFATRRPLGQAARMVLGLLSTLGSYYGYGALPLATATALGFAMPLFVTVLSVPLLGERVGWRRMSAVLAGFAGVLLIAHPWVDTGEVLPVGPVLIVLGAVLSWALGTIAVRRLGAAGESAMTIVLYYNVGATVLAGGMALPEWVPPPPVVLAGLIGVGAISAVAQVLTTEGYRTDETTLLAPFEYGAIIYAAALGAVFWGEWPDLPGWVGIALVIFSGLFIWRREVTLARRSARGR